MRAAPQRSCGPAPAGTPAGAPAAPPLARGLVWRIWLRTLALQACWNAQRMQNLGLLCALGPWLRAAAAGPQRCRRICRRHYEFFNTNPYLANLLVGGLLRLEADEGEAGRPPARIRVFKDSLARACASLGDQLFWMALQPALLLLAAGLGLLLGPWAALAPVALFAAAELEWRRRALGLGWRRGLELVDLLAAPGWHQAIRAGRRVALLAAGTLAGYVLGTAPAADLPLAAGIAGAGAAAALPLLLRRRLPGESLFALAALLALAVGYL